MAIWSAEKYQKNASVKEARIPCNKLSTIQWNDIEYNLDGVLGIRTQGPLKERMASTGESNELVRPLNIYNA